MARTYADYEKQARRYGPEGVLEVARRDLDDSEFERLEKLCKELEAQGKKRGRR